MVNATGTPFRVPSLLVDTVAKTCTDLILSNCEMEEVAPLIGMFYLLRTLDLSGNKLEEIPPDISGCYSLTLLDVSGNNLKTLPEEIGALIHLEKLLAFSNEITVLPDTLQNLPCLEFNVYNNKLLKVPMSLGSMEPCRFMNLAANVIMQVPAEAMANWRNVQILNLYDCRVLKIGSLAHMRELAELRLFNNNLEELPDLGTEDNKLRIVELNKNRITTLPLLWFKGFKVLERLVLSQNLISSIPIGISCPELAAIMISQNSLTELPPDLPLYPKLRVIFVNANSLQRLPETFLQNSQLERVNLARNSKCAQNSKVVLEHMKKVTAANGGKYWAPDTL
jgi:leucine-rich repeat protein SHOC2